MAEKFSKSFKEFLIKSAIFIVLFILIQLITTGIVAKTSLPGELKLFAMDDLAEAVLFALVIFIGLNRESFLKIKSYTVTIKSRIFSSLTLIAGFLIYFSYKIYLINNLELTARHIYIFTLIEYLLLFTILFFLITLVFGFKFCKDFFKAHKTKFLYILAGTVFVYFFIKEFQNLWAPLSHLVGNSANFLLNQFGNSQIYYAGNIPVIFFNDFSVGIAKTCSGIDSTLLFTGLYLGIVAWDWKILNKKKALGMFFVGIIGAFCLNIIRIFLLVLIGAFISENFALHTFHTNASSLLFIIYFAIFWRISYNWIKK